MVARSEAPRPVDTITSGPDPGPAVPLEELLRTMAASGKRAKTVTTNSGELTLHDRAAADQPAVVVKRVPDWTAAHARGLAFTLEACRRHAESTGNPSFAAQLYGWGDEPVYLATAWIDGDNVNHRMAHELAGLGPKAAVASSVETASGSAELVARYHCAMAACDLHPWELPKKSASAEEAGMAIRLIGLLRGSRGVSRSERVRSIDDPGPHNTIVGSDGELRLIDLPADFQITMVERDLARLASRLVGAIHRHSRSRWVPYRPIVEAVIEGYERVGSPGRRPIDRSLVYSCLAADAAIKVALTRRRLEPGTRLECFVRESAATVVLSARSLLLRARHSLGR